MKAIYPAKLRTGDTVRVVAPSHSLSILSTETRDIANRRFAELGLRICFGAHVQETDEFNSSSIESRIADLHAAFADHEAKAVFAVIGGYNANQLLRHIDWKLIKNHPKIFIGYSDATALHNSIFNKTGLVTYSGPAYSTFGQALHFDYTLTWFKKCLLENAPLTFRPADTWTDDVWYRDQQNRNPIQNDGWYAINEGEALGRLLGGNLTTFRLLQGTEYFPDLNDSVLFIEDDGSSSYPDFDRSLQALAHVPSFKGVRGLVLGRFQRNSKIERRHIESMIRTKKELSHFPVLANVDFGHTSPMITFPIGGIVRLRVIRDTGSIAIEKH